MANSHTLFKLKPLDAGQLNTIKNAIETLRIYGIGSDAVSLEMVREQLRIKQETAAKQL